MPFLSVARHVFLRAPPWVRWFFRPLLGPAMLAPACRAGGLLALPAHGYLATHDVDVMRYLSGSEVARVSAETARPLGGAGEDLICATLRFDFTRTTAPIGRFAHGHVVLDGPTRVRLPVALRPVSAVVAAVGSALAAGTFLVTLSFLLSTPGWEPRAGGFPALSLVPGQFLLKDVVLLGAAVWSLGEALGHASPPDVSRFLDDVAAAQPDEGPRRRRPPCAPRPRNSRSAAPRRSSSNRWRAPQARRPPSGR